MLGGQTVSWLAKHVRQMVLAHFWCLTAQEDFELNYQPIVAELNYQPIVAELPKTSDWFSSASGSTGMRVMMVHDSQVSLIQPVPRCAAGLSLAAVGHYGSPVPGCRAKQTPMDPNGRCTECWIISPRCPNLHTCRFMGIDMHAKILARAGIEAGTFLLPIIMLTGLSTLPDTPRRSETSFRLFSLFFPFCATLRKWWPLSLQHLGEKG